MSLTKRYEDTGREALSNLDLQCLPGEIFCLLGENGAGKTTTINLFLGYIAPTSGTASVDGISVADDPLATRKRIAYVPESVSLYGALTALENLTFFAGLTGTGAPTAEVLSEAMVEAGLDRQHHRRRVSDFSKGMRQKLALAMALQKRAPAMLLDEPTSGLDPHAAHDLLMRLQAQRSKGTAILMSTHDLFRAKSIADRIGIMAGGRLVCLLDRDQVQASDLESLYLQYVVGQEPAS